MLAGRTVLIVRGGRETACLSQVTSLLSEGVWLSNKNNSQTVPGPERIKQHHEIGRDMIDDDMNRVSV